MSFLSSAVEWVSKISRLPPKLLLTPTLSPQLFSVGVMEAELEAFWGEPESAVLCPSSIALFLSQYVFAD